MNRKDELALGSGLNDGLGDRIIVDYRHYVNLVNERDRLRDHLLEVAEDAMSETLCGEDCAAGDEPTDYQEIMYAFRKALESRGIA